MTFFLTFLKISIYLTIKLQVILIEIDKTPFICLCILGNQNRGPRAIALIVHLSNKPASFRITYFYLFFRQTAKVCHLSNCFNLLLKKQESTNVAFVFTFQWSRSFICFLISQLNNCLLVTIGMLRFFTNLFV